MAADILLYDTDEVPVGDDQRQHLELARDVAIRFNHRYGDTFVVPEAAIPPVGARVMDLQEPTQQDVEVRRLAAGHGAGARPAGGHRAQDQARGHRLRRRGALRRGEKPGVSNLLSILAASTGESPEALADRYSQYGPLKEDTAAAVIELLRPIQERYECSPPIPAR